MPRRVSNGWGEAYPSDIIKIFGVLALIMLPILTATLLWWKAYTAFYQLEVNITPMPMVDFVFWLGLAILCTVVIIVLIFKLRKYGGGR